MLNMKIQTLLFLSLVTILCMSCSKNMEMLHENAPSNDNDPFFVFQSFWVVSKGENLDNVKELLAEPPIKFNLCVTLSRTECDRQMNIYKEKEESSNIKDGGELMIKNVVPPMSEISSREIKRGIWKDYQLINQNIVDDEARLTIKIFGSGTGFFIQDFLLMKVETKWKIIAVVEPDRYSFWASNK